MLNDVGGLAMNAAVILGVITVLGALLALVLRFFAKRPSQLFKTMSMAAGVLTALFPIFLKSTGAKVVSQDEGKQVIQNFYEHIEAHEFKNAWDMIHADRKEEIKKTIQNEDDFAKTYATTRTYMNIIVELDHKEGKAKRFYWVVFDVNDQFPTNTIYPMLNQPVKEASHAGLVNVDRLTEMVANDLRKYYEVPPDATRDIKAVLSNVKLAAVFSPKLLPDIAIELKLSPKTPASGLVPFLNETNTTDLWTHYVENLELLNVDGAWKIRNGLATAVLEAAYPQGVRPPSMEEPTQQNAQ